MNFEKVVFSFFIILAVSLNFGFFVGDPSNPQHHHPYELFAALVVSLICTLLKFGDRSHFGSTMLACSLVADLQLTVAAIVWGVATAGSLSTIAPSTMSNITSLAGGALVANFLSVILLLLEAYQIRK